ncbi:MAG: alanine dehydrogenase [Bdellovibrionaceae bacterium]|nr:alanine dehydrogenase [Pseudobdellovibrionaceae bacterium]
MRVGVPKEIKISESRVGLTESGVRQFVAQGHEVFVETQAGLGCLITDENYLSVGAKIVDSAKEVYENAEMIIKVKEPLPQEYDLMQEGQLLFTYLHLAAEPQLAKILCDKKIQSIAYETIQESDGSLPLLTPMSEVAGRMATQVGAFYLQKDHGGKGILLGGVTGVKKAQVTIVGGGVVGVQAAKMAVGLGADVILLDIDHARLSFLDDLFQGRVQTLFSNAQNLEESVINTDLLIGAVLVAGHKAPQLITEAMIHKMSKGSVVVDVAVDQGGCIATCKPTSHVNPTYEINGVLHYCVPNIPGVVPRTSTYALTNATLPYGLTLAKYGLKKALEKKPILKSGINVYDGYIAYQAVAQDLNMEYRPYLN